MFFSSRTNLAAYFIALTFALISLSAKASSALAWNSSGSNMATATCWTPNQVPASGDVLTFPQAAAQKTVNNDLPAAFAGLIKLGGGYTISGNAFGNISIDGAGSSGSSTISCNIAGTFGATNSLLVLSGNISGGAAGSDSIYIDALANVTLSGNNSFVGNATAVNSGILQCGSTTALSAACTITIGAGATVKLNTFNQTVTNVSTVTGGTLDLGSATLTISQGGTGTTGTIGASIVGAGSIVKNGTGTTLVTGGATYTGPTNVNVGTLAFDSGFNNVTGTTNIDVKPGATLTGDGSADKVFCDGTFYPQRSANFSTFTCSDLTFSATTTFISEFTKASTGTVIAKGVVSLSNATLDLRVSSPTSLGTVLTLVDAVSTFSVAGKFKDLNDCDSIIASDGNAYTISYAGGPGNEDVIVTRADPTRPVIAGVIPSSGGVGDKVTVMGQLLSGATQVAFQGAAGTIPGIISSNTDTAIVVTVPPGAITGKITVTTPKGTAISPQNFLVLTQTTLRAVAGNILGNRVMFTVLVTAADGTLVTGTVSAKLKRPTVEDTLPDITLQDGAGETADLDVTDGQYTATFTYKGDSTHAQSTASVRFEYFVGFGNGKLVVIDGDGDGLPDKVKPPSGFTPGSAQPPDGLKVTDLKINAAAGSKLTRAATGGKDMLMFKGYFFVGPGFSSGSGLALIVAVGSNGIVKYFTIDSKGHTTPKGNESFQIVGKPKNGKLSFTAKFTRGSFIGDLTDAGFPIGTADIQSGAYNLPFGVYASFGTYLTTVKTEYSIKKGKFSAQLSKK